MSIGFLAELITAYRAATRTATASPNGTTPDATASEHSCNNRIPASSAPISPNAILACDESAATDPADHAGRRPARRPASVSAERSYYEPPGVDAAKRCPDRLAAPRAWPTFSSNDRSPMGGCRNDRWRLRRPCGAPCASDRRLRGRAIGSRGRAGRHRLRQRSRHHLRGRLPDAWTRSCTRTRYEFYSSKPPLLPMLVAGEYWVLQHAVRLDIRRARRTRDRAPSCSTFNVAAAWRLPGRCWPGWWSASGTTDWGRLLRRGRRLLRHAGAARS